MFAAFNSSYIWEYCNVLKHAKNIQLYSNSLNVEEEKDVREFSQYILDVVDRKITAR